MKKIVINACFGGFGLSYKAVMRYAEIKGFVLYPWFNHITRGVYKDRAVIGNPDILHHYSRVPLDSIPVDADGNPDIGRGYKGFYVKEDILRDDPALIQVVKEMGKEANDKFAELKIIEIPENVNWEIEEYDGNEHVTEQHQTWS